MSHTMIAPTSPSHHGHMAQFAAPPPFLRTRSSPVISHSSSWALPHTQSSMSRPPLASTSSWTSTASSTGRQGSGSGSGGSGSSGTVRTKRNAVEGAHARAVLDSLVFPVITVDENSLRIVGMNSSARRMLLASTSPTAEDKPRTTKKQRVAAGTLQAAEFFPSSESSLAALLSRLASTDGPPEADEREADVLRVQREGWADKEEWKAVVRRVPGRDDESEDDEAPWYEEEPARSRSASKTREAREEGMYSIVLISKYRRWRPTPLTVPTRRLSSSDRTPTLSHPSLFSPTEAGPTITNPDPTSPQHVQNRRPRAPSDAKRPGLPLRLSTLPSPGPRVKAASVMGAHVVGSAGSSTYSLVGSSASGTSKDSTSGTGSSASVSTSSTSHSSLFAPDLGGLATDPSAIVVAHEDNAARHAEALEEAGLPGVGISVTSQGIQLASSRPYSASAIAPAVVISPLASRQGRPTALPPPASGQSEASQKPGLIERLEFAALAQLPKVGVLLSSKDCAEGFVNPLARELLMGVPVHLSSASDDSEGEWWESGRFSTADEPVGSAAISEAETASLAGRPSFFPSFLVSPSTEISDPLAAFGANASGSDLTSQALSFDGIIASGEARRREDGTVEVGVPAWTNDRYRTGVASILARSLATEERRRAPFMGDLAEEVTSPAAPTESSESSYRTTAAKTDFFAVGGGGQPGRKPYKTYDASFSQRVIDPLEPLLELCVRRGEPSLPGQETRRVGIEVEVFEEVEELRKDSYDTPLSARRKKRVRRRIVEVSAAPVFGANGEHLGGVILLRDVTEDRVEPQSPGLQVPLQPVRKEGEMVRDGTRKKNVEDGDAYYKQIIDHMPQMVWTTTPMGSHTFFNNQWYDYTGLEPEQSLGLGWQSPFHAEDMPHTVKAWTHSLTTGEPYTTEYRCRRFDGEWRWMLGRAICIRDAEGTIQGWMGTCTDIHELVNIRSELAKTQEQVAAMIKGAEVLLIALDRQATVTLVEGSAKKSLQQLIQSKGTNEVVGMQLGTLWPEQELNEGVARVLAGDAESAKFEVTRGPMDSPSFYRCSLTPLTGNHGAIDGVVLVAIDITDLKQTQARLEQANEEQTRLFASETEAREASRLKTEFVANISHEIRTPIAGMIGMAELMIDDTDLSERQRGLLGQITRSGEILLEVVGMVLDIGKVEAGKIELEERPFSLKDVISDTSMYWVLAHKKGLGFVKSVNDIYAGRVMGDSGRLRQVLTNLISNAIKFTSEGEIRFTVSQEEDTEQQAVIQFVVEDTGVGIKEESIALLFRPYQQAEASTSRIYGGSGLGLSIAKSFTQLMGGTIKLESKYGHGTKMIVTIPFDKAPAEKVEEGSDTGGSSVSTTGRWSTRGEFSAEDTWVLVVDDNQVVRDVAVAMLKKLRYNVTAVPGGAEAIKSLGDRHYDVAFLDLQMPGISGLQATALIRQSADRSVRGVKIIAMTASAMADEEQRCLKAGMDGYLAKPVKPSTLEDAILRQLVPQGSVVGSEAGSVASSNPSVHHML